MGIKQSVHQF